MLLNKPVSSMRIWMCFVKRRTWRIMKKHRLLGVPERARKQIEGVLPGDFLLVYAGKPVNAIMAVCKVTSPLFTDTSMIWGDKDYPLRINIEPLQEFSALEDNPLPYSSIFDGQFSSSQFTPWFRGHSLIELTERNLQLFMKAARHQQDRKVTTLASNLQ